MAAKLKILSSGMLSSLQDQGRIGYGSFGVPRSGAVDPVALRLGNALVGNNPFEAAIEFRFMGPTVTVENGFVRIGLGCNTGGELTLADTNDKQVISPWQTITLGDGDILKIHPLQDGATGYLCVEGGFELSDVLDSCSTYARAKLGGHTGLPFQAGDALSVRQDIVPAEYEKIIAAPIAPSDKPLHVVLGPQEDYFGEAELASFLSAPFKVSSDVDRMGIRLEGEKLKALPEKGHDLISDGLVPGSIQVPGTGQPIILSVDCQSVGGYPKIATIISSDLYRLGQLTPGTEIKFKAVDLNETQALNLNMEKAIEKAIGSIQNYFGEGAIDLTALYEANLVGGVVDAQKPGHFPGHLEDTK